jgi:hypothetical protein
MLPPPTFQQQPLMLPPPTFQQQPQIPPQPPPMGQLQLTCLRVQLRIQATRRRIMPPLQTRWTNLLSLPTRQPTPLQPIPLQSILLQSIPLQKIPLRKILRQSIPIQSMQAQILEETLAAIFKSFDAVFGSALLFSINSKS